MASHALVVFCLFVVERGCDGSSVVLTVMFAKLDGDVVCSLDDSFGSSVSSIIGKDVGYVGSGSGRLGRVVGSDGSGGGSLGRNVGGVCGGGGSLDRDVGGAGSGAVLVEVSAV